MKNLPETKKIIAIVRAVGILLLIILSLAQAGGKPDLFSLGIMLFLVPLGFVSLPPAVMFALDLGAALLSSYLAPGEDACLYSCVFSFVYLAYANPMTGILSLMLAQATALALKMHQLNSNFGNSDFNGSSLASSDALAQLFQTLWHTDWFNFAGTLIALYVVAYSLHADGRRETAEKSLNELQALQTRLEEQKKAAIEAENQGANELEAGKAK